MSLRCDCARGEDLSFRSNLMYFTGLIKLAYLLGQIVNTSKWRGRVEGNRKERGKTGRHARGVHDSSKSVECISMLICGERNHSLY